MGGASVRLKVLQWHSSHEQNDFKSAVRCQSSTLQLIDRRNNRVIYGMGHLSTSNLYMDVEYWLETLAAISLRIY